jgi:Zn-finger nucleic acid-binding protein
MAEKKAAKGSKRAPAAKGKGAGAEAAAAAPVPGQTPAGQMKCPRCSAPMKEFEHLGITLDGCTGCEGLFFDAGELEEVLKREFPEAMAAAADFYASTVSLDGESPPPTGGEPSNVSSFFRSLFTRRRTETAASPED